ncbi:MAG TPA: hypothetical protein VG738_04960 [Chitinophagaceae bacterium]|nr:hypothetical protein [Chitinophagaceae bacterium]
MQKTLSAACLVCLFAIPFFVSSCKTISVYDDTTFVNTSTLKAQAVVLMDHATENYSQYADKVDAILIDAQKLYAMQKAREKNQVTIAQWQKLMAPDPVTKQSVLPGFFALWKKKKTLQQDFIDDAKTQVSDAFDEILKLEGAKLKN